MGKEKIKKEKQKKPEGGEGGKLLSSSLQCDQEFEGLAGFEEVASCTLLKLGKRGRVRKEVLQHGKIVKKKNINLNTLAAKKAKKKKKRKKKNKVAVISSEQKTCDVVPEAVEVVDSSAAADSPTTPQDSQPLQQATTPSHKRKKVKTNKKTGAAKKARYDSKTFVAAGSTAETEVDVSAWEEVFVPEPVLRAISTLGFTQPTQIQKLVLPAAIKGRMDIIGAAETGSGKTLAFGIPIIHGILQDRKREEVEAGDSGLEVSDLEAAEADSDQSDEQPQEDPVSSEECEEKAEMTDSDQEADDQEAAEADSDQCEAADLEDPVSSEECEEQAEMTDSDHEADDQEDAVCSEEFKEEADMTGSDNEEAEEGLGCVKVVEDVEFDFLGDGIETVSQSVGVKKSSRSSGPRKKLRALIVTPTRELAIQINSHLTAILVHTDIRTAVVMGGVAPQKQERLLARGPEIVIGTPGRLWELIQQGNEHLGQAPSIKYLAVDETDRMVERGHFQELTQLLELINNDPEAKAKRQTFVFSATLTMVHNMPKRLHIKKAKKMTSELKISQLAQIIGVKAKPKIIDVTRKFGTAECLTEARINCSKDEKDLYLYYFLKRYPGRSLVFCNSIDCVRRLQNLFTLLQCQPQSLHASLQQKQRLKSLERFSSSPQALLLATDVAARGLDIPNIQHVIHYQVPRTAETYIHRSGRTARASQEGLSVLLVESAEVKKYRELCRTLNRNTDLPAFPVDGSLMSQVKQRLSLARSLEKMEHSARKVNAQKDWLKRAAQEAEIMIDEDDVDEDQEREQAMKAARERRELKDKRTMLLKMLSKPFTASGFSGKYPTQSGALMQPLDFTSSTTDHNKALQIMKEEAVEYSKLYKTVKVTAPFVKQNKKKNKGFKKRKLKQKKEKENMKKSHSGTE